VKRRTLRLVLACAAIVLAAGCSSSQPGSAAASPTPPASPTPAPPSPTAAPPPPTGAPAGTGRCLAPGLRLDAGDIGAAAGNRYLSISFTNTSGSACWLYGFPGMLMLDASGRAMPTRVVRAGPAMFATIDATPRVVTLGQGASAPFFLHYGVVPSGSETSCPESSQVLVTPPDETRQLRTDLRIAPCQGGTIDVSPVEPPGTHL